MDVKRKSKVVKHLLNGFEVQLGVRSGCGPCRRIGVFLGVLAWLPVFGVYVHVLIRADGETSRTMKRPTNVDSNFSSPVKTPPKISKK